MKTAYIKKAGIALSLFIVLQLLSTESEAQLNPLGGMYFQNQYLANPAMAGLDSGLALHIGYRQAWSSMPGAPKTQSFTGTYGLNDKVGLGLNIYNDEAGLLKRNRVMATYAYHLPINGDDQKLSFGLSLGFMNERVGYEDLNGDPNDPNISRFNQRETFIDGDFGVAYTSNKFTIQGAIPNMKTFFKKDDNTNTVDRSVFFGAVSYKLYFPNALDGLGVEPKVALRGVKGYDHIGDVGANFTFAKESVSMMGIYHTSQSATFGLGLNYRRTIAILALYTTQTSALTGYTNGNFELALKASLF